MLSLPQLTAIRAIVAIIGGPAHRLTIALDAKIERLRALDPTTDYTDEGSWS